MADLNELRKTIEQKIGEFTAETDKLQTEFEKSVIGLTKKGYKIDKEKLPDFMARFWHTYPTKTLGEFEVAVPVFVPFNIGWFDRVEGGYNIFVVNKYTQWLGDSIPVFISHEIKMPPTLNILLEGQNLEFEKGKQEQVEKLFGSHLSLVEENKAVVKQGHEFDLIAEIIDSGSLPFKPNPVKDMDLMEGDFTKIWDEVDETFHPLNIFEGKYSFQGEAFNTFLKYGAIGIFWAMGSGKTIIGTYAFSRIKGLKRILVPSITLKEHWEDFFKHNCPRLLQEVEIVTYQGLSQKTWKEIRDKEVVLTVFDECHFLPADTFSKLATLKSRYRVGLSATPYREDGRTNYIMALTGFPVGLDWRTTLNLLGKSYHQVNVHIVKTMEDKYVLCKELFNPERRTLFFVNLLEVGHRLADVFDLPFISGSTKNRMDIIHKSKSFIASRVLELGVSIKDLEHVIEVDFLFGSRREEVQRTGRLMHSVAEGKVHDILMTKTEFDSYGKRLFGLYEKGFRYKLIPHLSGVEVVQGTEKKRHMPAKKGSASYTKVIEELFKEGYFQSERVLADVCKSLERRGVSTGGIRTNIGVKLNGMVKTRKLFKIESKDGYKFKQRS